VLVDTDLLVAFLSGHRIINSIQMNIHSTLRLSAVSEYVSTPYYTRLFRVIMSARVKIHTELLLS
jgi:hypothetical protein